MADLTIESIAIEITTSVEKADKALEKLEKNLLILKAACTGGLEGAESFAKGVKQIAEASKGFNSVDGDKIKNAASALRSLKSIGDIGNLSNAAHQMKNLQKISETVAAMPEIDSTKISRIRAFGNAFKSLSQIGEIPDLSKLANSLQPLVSATNAINQTDMSNFAANMQQLAAGMQPLSGMQNHNFSSVVRGLERLPSISKSLSHMNFGTFARQMQQVATAIQPLSRQMRSLSSSFSRLPAPVQQAVTSMMNYNTSVQNATTRTSGFGKSLKLLNFTAMYFAVKRVVNILGQFITSSNEYVENLNLFTVTMGEAADEALKFANTVNEAMGIDVSQWIQNQGVFKQMTSGFGMVEEKANMVSKNLTQLGYDISSYYNISVESAMQKLQSGMAGEIMPLRSLGYALDEATIKQVALNHGITENVTNMSQAQKAQLRYIAIMEQSTNAMGDMARTIESPANQIRILESRIQTLKRAIGDSLMPVVSAALPYVTAFVQIVGEAFRNLAEFMGFELPKFDYSDLITKDNKAVADSFDEATAASKAFKGTLSSIDQLNIIGSKSETSTGTGNNLGADLNLELPSYDFLGNLKNETSEAYNTLKDFLKRVQPIAEKIAAVLATMFALKGVANFIESIKSIGGAFKILNSSMLGKLAIGITAGVAAFMQFRKVVKDLATGNGGMGSLIGSIGAVTAGATALVALGNPIGAVVAVLGAAIGAIQGANEVVAELNATIERNMLFTHGTATITEIADAFSDWAGKAKQVNDQIIDQYGELEKDRAKVDELYETVKSVAGIQIDFSKFTPADAEALKGPFDELATYLKTDFEETAKTIVSDLEGIFASAKIAQPLIDEVTKGYQEIIDLFGSNIDKAQTTVKTYLSKIAASGTLTAAEQADFQKNYQLIMDTANLEDNKNLDYALKQFNELDLSKIDFETDTTAQEMLRNIMTEANAYQDSIMSRLTEEQKNLMVMLEELEIHYNAGVLDQSQYEESKALLEQSAEIFTANAVQQLNDLANKISTVQDAAGLQVRNASREMSPDLLDTNLAIGARGWLVSLFDPKGTEKLAQDLAASRYLDNSGIFAATQELKDQINDIRSTELDLKAKISSDNQIAQQIINGENIEAKVTLYPAYSLNAEAAKWAEKAGNWIEQGLESGWNISTWENYNKELADAGAKAFCEKYGIHSPSTLFESFGEYMMKGLTNGIDGGRKDVLASLDNTAIAMEQQMKDVKFDIPVYTEEYVDKTLNATWRGSFGSMQGTAQAPQYKGADRQAMTDAGNAYAQNGIPINVEIALQSYVELDGEQVGQAEAQYQQKQMAYSNGYGY